ncbi:MAG TPA: TraR/DksA family transcriptional regulator [Candidatus Binataceae bacterium]|nr:TraR/DksA family transcriptional regulator [Candidatus Binataceae bacterium]
MKKTIKKTAKKGVRASKPAKASKPVKAAKPVKPVKAKKSLQPQKTVKLVKTEVSAKSSHPLSASRKRFLEQMRKELIATKTRLLGEIDSELRAEREANKDEGMDTYDLASEERDREINFILSDRERVKLQQIDDALARMEESSYGVCESCGLEIAEERLTAMPFTRLCRDCQQDQEREARSQRRYDDEHTYRKLGSTDAEDESA